MSDFLSKLAARSLGTSEVIQARIPSLYEPYRQNGGPLVARPGVRPPETESEPQRGTASERDDGTARAEFSFAEPRVDPVPDRLGDNKDTITLKPKAQPTRLSIGEINAQPARASYSSPEDARRDARSPALRVPTRAATPAALDSGRSSISPSVVSQSGPPLSGVETSSGAPAPPIRALREDGEPVAKDKRTVIGRHRPPPESSRDSSGGRLLSREELAPAAEFPTREAFRSAQRVTETLQSTIRTHHAVQISEEPSPSKKPASKPASNRARRSTDYSPDPVGSRTTSTHQAPMPKIQLPEESQPRSALPLANVIRPSAAPRSESAKKALRDSTDSEPTVEITIGTVEVRAIFPEKPAPRAPLKRPKPTVSLDDYLRRSSRGPP